MPKDGASRAQQKKVSKRASLTVPRGRTDSGNAHNRRETHRPGTSDEEVGATSILILNGCAKLSRVMKFLKEN
jgi:hypothetical protein